MAYANCPNCGALARVVKTDGKTESRHVAGDTTRRLMALPGEKARAGLAAEMDNCPNCGAPRVDPQPANTMDDSSSAVELGSEDGG